MEGQGLARRNQRSSLLCGEPVLLAGVLIGIGHAAMLGLIALSRQSLNKCCLPHRRALRAPLVARLVAQASNTERPHEEVVRGAQFIRPSCCDMRRCGPAPSAGSFARRSPRLCRRSVLPGDVVRAPWRRRCFSRSPSGRGEGKGRRRRRCGQHRDRSTSDRVGGGRDKWRRAGARHRRDESDLRRRRSRFAGRAPPHLRTDR